MKYSNLIGVLAALCLIASCFLPWVYISPIQTTITGYYSGNTNYGSPGIIHTFFSAVSVILFLLPQIWAKPTNIFLLTLNFAWSIRNYLLITHCELGECPEKKAGVYAIVFFAFIMFIMALLPRVRLKD